MGAKARTGNEGATLGQLGQGREDAPQDLMTARS